MPRKHYMWYITSQGISYLYSLLVTLNIILRISFYNHTIWVSPALSINCFTLFHQFLITYFHVICKYYHIDEDGGVLGYSTQDYQREIPLRKYWMRFPINISPLFIPTLDFKFQILNQHCAPKKYQNNLITFILTYNINNYLS